MRIELIKLNETRNVSLTCFLQEVNGEFGFSRRPAVLVLPGGGYAMCSEREADPAALSYLKAGYQAFVLRYTVGDNGGWPLPLEDYEQAMALILEKADEWHVEKNRIAVVGFSAGGHLAACAATMAEHKPAAAVLVYPAILKEIVDMCKPDMPYPNEHVDRDTCPCFLAAARDDRTVDIKNTLMMELALAEHSVAFESHIYSFGGHGFSTAEEWISTNSVSERVPHWVEDSVSWLKEIMGGLTRRGMSEPNSAISVNGDCAPVLSVACSLEHILMQSPEVKKLLSPMFDRIKALAAERGFSVDGLTRAVSRDTLREIMEQLGFSAEEIGRVDIELHKIINQSEN